MPTGAIEGHDGQPVPPGDRACRPMRDGIVAVGMASLSVHCPGCGGSTVDHGTGHKPSRWHCASLRCAFRHGWRLELAHHHQLEPLDGDNTIYAIPVTSVGVLNVDEAVLWPSVAAGLSRMAEAA